MRFYWTSAIMLTAIFLFSEITFSQEMSVFEIRRNIPLSDTEPVYRDFYIKGNESTGLKKNMIVQVTRKITLRDSSGSQVMGEIQAPVGQLKIIGIYGKIAVARELKIFSREDLPMLDQPWIMIGDSIDLHSKIKN